MSKLEHGFNLRAVPDHQMLIAQFLKFDAGPAVGLPIRVKQVHAARKSIDVFIRNFLSHKRQHAHGPRVTADVHETIYRTTLTFAIVMAPK